jgi:hypothetical protein
MCPLLGISSSHGCCRKMSRIERRAGSGYLLVSGTLLAHQFALCKARHLIVSFLHCLWCTVACTLEGVFYISLWRGFPAELLSHPSTDSCAICLSSSQLPSTFIDQLVVRIFTEQFEWFRCDNLQSWGVSVCYPADFRFCLPVLAKISDPGYFIRAIFSVLMKAMRLEFPGAKCF